jgi:hypothetical protein
VSACAAGPKSTAGPMAVMTAMRRSLNMEKTRSLPGRIAFSAVASAANGCISAAASGGDCGPQALAAGISAAAGPLYSNNRYVGSVEAAVVGGAASVAGGGKFANGAVTGAFSYAAGASYGSGGAANDNDPFSGILGKIWDIPNSAIGLGLGTIDSLATLATGQLPHFGFGNGALQISNLIDLSSLGGSGAIPSEMFSFSITLRRGTPLKNHNMFNQMERDWVDLLLERTRAATRLSMTLWAFWHCRFT